MVGNPTKKITFLTGAKVSRQPQVVPDYRSLKGVSIKESSNPEYLFEPDLLKNREPEKFYQFVKTLYHPADAQPAIISFTRKWHIIRANETGKNCFTKY